MKTTKRLLSVLLSLALIAGLWTAFPVRAEADTGISYLDANGDEQFIDNYTVIDEANIASIDSLNGWYVVRGVINRSTTLEVAGTAHLILEDGAHLTVQGAVQTTPSAGIKVAGGKTLNIYAQSTGNDMGVLTAAGDNWGAGIGSANNAVAGVVTINGGTVTATGGNWSAGIGGGWGDNGDTVTINGGVVTATGGYRGAGIGSGWGGKGGVITINGGSWG
jgi:hypothetical protein